MSNPMAIPFEEAMQAVLQRPAYNILTGRTQDLREAFWDAVRRFISNLLRRIPVPEGSLSLPEYNLDLMRLIFIAATGLLLFAAVTVGVYFVLRYRGRRRRAAASMAAVFDDIAKGRLSLAELLRQTAAYAESGKLREAVRHYYIAALVSLHDAQVIQVAKSKTNAQLRHDIAAAAPPLSAAFADVAEAFERAWFGKKPLNEADYGLYAAKAGELIDAQK